MAVTSSTTVTIDTSQSFSGATFKVLCLRLSVTAADLIGDNIRIRRVRVINFGTRTPLQFDGVTNPEWSYEGFPLRI